jgi:hypothetical protein
VRREERLLSRTAICMDRVGIVDDLSEGVFRLPYPLAPAPPESHMSRGQAYPTRQAQADKPSLSASPPRLEQAAYRGEQRHFLFHSACKKQHMQSEKYLLMHVYVYVLDGIATANREVGISGYSRSSPCLMRPSMAQHGGPRESSRFIRVLL